ncbi:hypothetical protein ABZ540_14895 [Nocardia xishanensis]|uniref:hypothetical protein n=1 Tax=Nocardia xishanensis TaxID=238964 RepID=UPI0033FEF909
MAAVEEGHLHALGVGMAGKELSSCWKYSPIARIRGHATEVIGVVTGELELLCGTRVALPVDRHVQGHPCSDTATHNRPGRVTRRPMRHPAAVAAVEQTAVLAQLRSAEFVA